MDPWEHAYTNCVFPFDALAGRGPGRGGSGGSLLSLPEDVDFGSTTFFVNS